MSDALANIRIVLVEPAGALNVGSIARVMKNMGLQQLVLVDPHCDPLGAEARQMAVHGGDVLAAARQVATLPEALQGCQKAIATTGRDRALAAPLELPRVGLPWLLEQPSDPQVSFAAALIFGPEDRGLSNVELNYAQRFVRIPSSPAYPSLNLAQAAAICCYELYLLTSSEAAQASSTALSLPAPDAEPAPLDLIEQFYQHLAAVLLKIGYLYPHTAASRMEKFRRLFNRANLSIAEVALLRGILGQVEWLWRTRNSKPDKSD
jgi:tRNA/rRNA methyltransferase